MARKTPAQKAADEKKKRDAASAALQEKIDALTAKGDELTDEEKTELADLQNQQGVALSGASGDDSANDDGQTPVIHTKADDLAAKIAIHGEEAARFGESAPIHELLQEQRELDRQIREGRNK